MFYPHTIAKSQVTCVLAAQGKVTIIEHVPARVCVETGERLFAPDTVEHLQEMVWEQRTPTRVIETPVFEFAT